MKKMAIFIYAGVLSIVAANGVYADEDDAQWVAQCISDNQSAGQSTETLTKYCTCMNDKMSDSETQSISEWEKAHPKENVECSKEADWADEKD